MRELLFNSACWKHPELFLASITCAPELGEEAMRPWHLWTLYKSDKRFWYDPVHSQSLPFRALEAEFKRPETGKRTAALERAGNPGHVGGKVPVVSLQRVDWS